MSAKSSQARRKINAFNKAGKIMKYYDNQPARKGDKFIIGTFGTCRVEEIDEHAHVATVRNTKTEEVFIARDPITGEVHHFDPVNQCWVLMPDKGASARIAELEAALKESNETLSNAEKMLSGIYREIELHGEWEKGVSECIDELRATISNNQRP